MSINFRVDDMRLLNNAPMAHYGVVIVMDNSLPHLDSNEEILFALIAMRNRLKRGGILLLSIRDYGQILRDRPNVIAPKFFLDGKYRRIVHQVWDWIDERRYIIHLYITYEDSEGWKSHHFTGQYRAIEINEMADLVIEAGFIDVKILEPKETGYYQPIISGKLM